ncbi:DEAD/DEAH box helicase [Uliginosibacterium sp. TH139]|uniref:DEAD/DEAH box helicase n=1 Tax=Uliginosibacterium sp. TH139 TaxID=2067453 RepID=UPI000C7A4487|nr:DEAD/DEAH box helicase [Uliginosibacterium sp. TH139]PLK49324.1 RNA helicase [Uliginosibacterium sp. TH139]
MSFASLGLSEPIVRAVSERGYTTPTPIQAQAIPAVLNGGDLLAGAQTGTGKTAGFTLPLLQRLTETPARKKGAIRALVLTPTRELAAQVEESVRHYGVHLPLKSMMMFGGVSINPQIGQLKRGVDILVATPGRLLDHVQQKTIDLSGVEILVLDEADRMLDMGFIRDIKKVLALLPKQRQNLLFSATFSDEIKALADGLLNKPAMIEVARRNAPIELVTQRAMFIDQKAKRHLLAHLIKEHAWFQVLVFTRTKHGANRLAEQLTKGGIPSLAIHGNKSQNARTRALAEFKSGDLQVLVATDIAARGIDISELPHVVNFELPNVPEDYVHRIGRTGRAGSTGEALSLVSSDEGKFLADIEKLTKRKIERIEVPAFEMPENAAAETDDRPPRQPQGRGRQGQGQRREGGRNEGGREGAARKPAQPRARSGEGRSPQGNERRAAPARPAEEGRAERPAGQARRNGPAGEGAGRAHQSPRQGQHARPPRRGEPNGNKPAGVRREVNGNVPEAPSRDADGNRAGRDTHLSPDPSKGIKGVFARGLKALRNLG